MSELAGESVPLRRPLPAVTGTWPDGGVIQAGGELGERLGQLHPLRPVRARVIAYNPMAEVERPRVEESEDVFLTPAQVEMLADAMGRVAPRYRALVWVGC